MSYPFQKTKKPNKNELHIVSVIRVEKQQRILHI